jgi:hypothetical protein
MVAKALDSLRWYQRTRPDALRHLLAPGFVTLVTLLFALVWGQPHLMVLAVLFAAVFMLLAGELTGELRDLDTDVRSAAAASPEIAHGLAELTVERSPAADVEREPAESESQPTPAPPAPLPVEETEPSTLSLLTPLAPPPQPSLPPALEHEASPESVGDPIHEVREPGTRLVLHTCRSFLDACDFAFDHIEEHDPDALEISLVTGESRMQVWSYARSDAAATAGAANDG